MASRRRFLGLAGGLAVPATTGCFGLGPSSAGEAVEGSWPEHGRTSARTGQTADRGPTGDVAVRWEYDVGYPVRGTPAVADGRVYVGGRGEVLALGASTGRPDWRVDVDGPGSPTTAAVRDGVVYVPFGETLHALDAGDGSERWQRTFGDHLRAPTVVGDTLYTTVARTGQLRALSVADGSDRWTARVGSYSWASPAVADGRAYLTGWQGGETGRVAAFDAESGDELWTYDVPAVGDDDPVVTTPSVHDGRVYVGANDGSVHAVDAATGERVWTFDPGTSRPGGAHLGSRDGASPPARVSGGLATGDGTVYVAHGDGRLYALDTATGERRWAFRAWNRFEAGPSVGDGAVYVGNVDSFVYALSADTGERLWEVSTAEAIGGSSPAIVDGHAFLGTGDGRVYALWEGAA